MKSTAIVCAIAAASLGFGSMSFAQPNDTPGMRSEQRGPRQGDRNDRHQEERRADRQDDRRGNSHANRNDDNRRNDRPEWRDDRRYDYPDARRNDRHDYYNARGPQFRRGGYIPYEYRSRQYVVTNYGPYRLSPPPRGHQWVQVGSDYVLIAIATGLIANIILNN